jgi:hypothetical protein
MWLVWVGGVEVHDWEIESEDDAVNLALAYHEQGHDDVRLEEVGHNATKLD